MIKQKHNPWLKTSLAWRWVKYWKEPARPLKQELNYIKELLRRMKRKGENPQVLILGSTSEYRDLMIDSGLRATVVDFWSENHHILSHKMRHFKHYKRREIYVKQKWQEINIGRKFNLIIGHFALNVNVFSQWEAILKSIQKHLKKDGIFFTNCWVRLSNKKPDFKKVIDEYNKRWKNKYSLWLAMMPKIYFSAYNVKNEWMAYQDLCQVFERAYQDKLVSQKDYHDYLNMGYKYFDFRLVIPDRGKVIRLFKKHFKIKRIIYFDYPCSRYMPDFILARR